MKRILISLTVTAALFFGMAGAQPALALEAVTLSAAGWSNPSIGSWDPVTGVAILEQDVAGLTIQPNIAPSVIVEGNGHLVAGSGASNSNGVNITGWTVGQLTVRNLVISRFTRGIVLNGSTGVTLQANSISSCNHGIYLLNSSGNTLVGNTANLNTVHGIILNGGGGNTLASNRAGSNSADGMRLTYSNNNQLTGNTLTGNRQHGLFIERCSANSLSGNAMTQNAYNFRLDGYSNPEYAHSIDGSNTVGGKPILYVVGATTGGVYDATSTNNAGTVYLANCDGVTVRGLTLSGNHTGVHLWSTTNSVIEDIQAQGNAAGIYLQASSRNTVRRCTISGNGWYGIFLDVSNDNTLTGNTIATSGIYGAYLSEASNNLVYGNQFLSNPTQASVSSGSGNTFYKSKPVGGNYWSDYALQGLQDLDGDGFLEGSYVFPGGRDDLPLAYPPSGDRTPPVTTIDLAGTMGANGWYRSDVTVTLTAADEGGSGVAYSQYSLDNVNWIAYQAPFTVSSEGTTSVYYRSVDRAGNVEQSQGPVVLNIDKTPPVLTLTAVVGDAGQDNWYRSDVTVAFSAADAVSGLADPSDATVTLTASGEGAAVSSGTREVCDLAGNAATAGPLTFKIDKTPPVTVGTPTTTPSAAGWYNTGVTIVWSASDDLSGVDPATLPPPSVIGGEGAGQGAIASQGVADLAGNADAIAAVSGINIDWTPPVISIKTPQPYATLPSGTALDFGASDALSGVAGVTGRLRCGDTTRVVKSGDVLLDSGVYTLVVEAVDLANNVAMQTVEFVVYDPSGGFVTGGGWFTSPPGAYPAAPTLSGRVSFGFVSKAGKGVAPNGQTEFHFQAAGLDFHSTAYDSLVVSGSKATFKGTGTINGSGRYSFTVLAVDNTPDRLRIKIVDAAGAVVYDSNLGADETSGPTTAIEGGSISVKKG